MAKKFLDLSGLSRVWSKIGDKFALKSLYGDTTINVGRASNTTVGTFSNALGTDNTASGYCSTAIGEGNTSGDYGVALGEYTTASGEASITGGSDSIASGAYSMAYGEGAQANGETSFALGTNVKAQRKNQLVVGRYNIEDTTGSSGSSLGSYAEIVGNGTGSNARSNARTTDWSGNGWFAGDVKVGGTNYNDTNAKALMKEPLTEGTSGQVLTTDGNGGRTWTTVSGGGGGVGEDLTGQTVYPEDGWQTTAGTNAEIFNDYRTRTYEDAATTAGNVASGNYSHAEGEITTASGNRSHAEGYNTNANGNNSHVEGSGTYASGSCGHAEGGSTTASGDYSHTEGNNTTANGINSHAEGNGTATNGSNSHAEGTGTTAQRKSQHVQGEYNILDTTGTTTTRGKYAHIVGNGTSGSARSNAHTIDWNGLGWYAGGLKVGGTSQDDTNAKNVLTEDKITYGTTDLTAGTSPLATGTLYFVYE